MSSMHCMLKAPSALKHVTKFLFETQHLVIEGRTILCDLLKKSFTRLFCFKQIFESGILSSPACNFCMKLIQLGILQSADLRGWLDQLLRPNSLSCLLPPCRRCPPRRGCFGSCLGSCTLASQVGELLHQCFQQKTVLRKKRKREVFGGFRVVYCFSSVGLCRHLRFYHGFLTWHKVWVHPIPGRQVGRRKKSKTNVSSPQLNQNKSENDKTQFFASLNFQLFIECRLSTLVETCRCIAKAKTVLKLIFKE